MTICELLKPIFAIFIVLLIDLWLGLDVSLEHDNLETRLYYLKISIIVS